MSSVAMGCRYDFAAAKNYAISKANCEWIAFLDADEYFSKEDGKKLAHYLKQLQGTAYDGIVTAFVELDNEGKVLTAGTHLRIFRNMPELKYYRKIHECLKKDGAGEMSAGDLTKELTSITPVMGKQKMRERRKADGISI